MTAFEKSLRALDEEAMRAGAEELLTLLAEADGIRPEREDPGAGGGQKRRDAAAARVSALVAADASPKKSGASASGGAVPKTARGRRAYPETDGGGTAAEDAARKDDKPLPEPAFPETTVGGDRDERKERKSRENREAWKGQDDREVQENPADQESREKSKSRKNREDRENRESREDWEKQIQTLRLQDREMIGQAETHSLEERLQSVSKQRRGRVQLSGEDGAHTAAFRGPERQYEGAVGARGMEMRRISDYFRRDSRRYDSGFTTY